MLSFILSRDTRKKEQTNISKFVTENIHSLPENPGEL